jgi:hypothetical protein
MSVELWEANGILNEDKNLQLYIGDAHCRFHGHQQLG